MNNEENIGKGIGHSAKIVLILAVFIMLVAGGLLAVDMNFNSIAGRPEKVNILVIDKLSDDVYKVSLMGTERDVNIGACERAFKKTGSMIFAGVSNAKDFISEFLDQAKRCSTI